MVAINLIIGFMMLVFGANFLVEGTVKLAKRFKLSTMMISMTIISIGTSMPELAIACISSFKGSQITLSNNIGSNISTIAISLGFTSIFYMVYIKKDVSKDIIKMLLIQIIVVALLLIGNKLDYIDGLIFLGMFLIYMRHLIKNAKKIVDIKHEKDIIKQEQEMFEKADVLIRNSIITVIIFILIGFVLLTFGGNMVVDAAIIIAKIFDLPEQFIAVTIVAFGTTLPELSTAIVAAKKGEYDIIIGNLVGSGVSNILLIVGIAALIHPIYYTDVLLFQLGSMLLFGLMMYVLSKKGKVERSDGFTLIITYILFVFMSLFIA